MNIDFKNEGEHLRAIVDGHFSLFSANQTFDKLIEAVEQSKVDKVLIDCLGMKGDLTFKDRVQHTLHGASAVRAAKERNPELNLRLAYLVQERYMDRDRIGKAVAINRGVNVREFLREDNALLWLRFGLTDKHDAVEVPDETVKRWQGMVDILANILDAPAVLIMRLIDADIEVFVTADRDGNPYKAGDHEHFLDSGLYCETVIKTQERLMIPNALKDDNWKNNPDIKLNMISYLGFPVTCPNGEPFGTICVLDSKERQYSETYEKLILEFRDNVEQQIELIFLNQSLGDENRALLDYLSELKMMRGLLPICCMCKKIRDQDDEWQNIEKYVEHRSDAAFSHGYCPECAERMMKQIESMDD